LTTQYQAPEVTSYHVTAFEEYWGASKYRTRNMIGYSDKKCLAWEAYSAAIAAWNTRATQPLSLTVDEGGEMCARCGGNNPSWSVPSPLWNAVMRGGSINGDALYHDMVCVKCFMQIAEEKGLARGWRLMATEVSAELETVTPSGRVWDERDWLWKDPAGSALGDSSLQKAQTSAGGDTDLAQAVAAWRDHFAPDGKRIRLDPANKESLHAVLGRVVAALGSNCFQNGNSSGTANV